MKLKVHDRNPPQLRRVTLESSLQCRQVGAYTRNASVDAIEKHDLGAICYRFLQARDQQHAAALRFGLRPIMPCVFAANQKSAASLACPVTWLTIAGGPWDIQLYIQSRTTKRACKAALIGAMGSETAFRALVGSRQHGLQRTWTPLAEERFVAANIPSQTFQALCQRRGTAFYRNGRRDFSVTLPTLEKPSVQAA